MKRIIRSSLLGFTSMMFLWLGFSTAGSDPGSGNEVADPGTSVVPDSVFAGQVDIETDEAPLGHRYVDPKGNFKINPPMHWEATDYPDDPRGKVVFTGPQRQVDLRVLVSDFGVSDFEQFFELTQENATDVERRTGVKVSLVREQFLDREIIRRSFTVKGLRMTAVMFLEGSRKHDIQYAAPVAAYADYEKAVAAAISTYEPLVPDHASSPAEHQLANALRLAVLFSDMNRRELALEYVERGLQIDPEHKKLLELKQRLASSGNNGKMSSAAYLEESALITLYEKTKSGDAQALEDLRAEAASGNGVAQLMLGNVFAKGKGVKKDYREAHSWYQQAAEQGHSEAQYNLGQLYRNGQGVKRDYETAAAWYRKAANQGNKGALYNLGGMYFEGRGVPQSETEAEELWKKAAALGHQGAKRMLDQLR